ncbi:hypothetical protein C8F01DRAFT_1307462, partial [Mycena amicta]
FLSPPSSAASSPTTTLALPENYPSSSHIPQHPPARSTAPYDARKLVVDAMSSQPRRPHRARRRAIWAEMRASGLWTISGAALHLRVAVVILTIYVPCDALKPVPPHPTTSHRILQPAQRLCMLPAALSSTRCRFRQEGRRPRHSERVYVLRAAPGHELFRSARIPQSTSTASWHFFAVRLPAAILKQPRTTAWTHDDGEGEFCGIEADVDGAQKVSEDGAITSGNHHSHLSPAQLIVWKSRDLGLAGPTPCVLGLSDAAHLITGASVLCLFVCRAVHPAAGRSALAIPVPFVLGPLANATADAIVLGCFSPKNCTFNPALPVSLFGPKYVDIVFHSPTSTDSRIVSSFVSRALCMLTTGLVLHAVTLQLCAYSVTRSYAWDHPPSFHRGHLARIALDQPTTTDELDLGGDGLGLGKDGGGEWT